MSSARIRDALERIAHGVYIIIVKHGSKVNGMTAAWVNQVSSLPPMISVAIGKAHYTAELISKVKSFSVNVLSPKQIKIAKKCGFISGRVQNKLHEQDLSYQVTKTPIIKNCAAYFDCQLAYQIEVGDHILFIGTVINAEDSKQPTLFYRSSNFFN